MKSVIEKLIKRLQYYLGLEGILRSSQTRERALLIADTLQDALAENEFYRCKTILFIHLCELYTTNYDGAPPYEPEFIDLLEEAYMQIEDMPSCENGSCSLPRTSEELPGAAVIHRVWLGKQPGRDRLTKMLAGNIAVSRIWRCSQSGRRVAVRKILWTNNSALLSLQGSIRDTEIKNISEVIPLETALGKCYYSFAAREEYAFASDIARVVILKRYGGLFLGMPWTVELTGSNEALFTPTCQTFKVFSLPMYNATKFPFELVENKLNNSEINPERHNYEDSDVIYAPRANHPVISALEINITMVLTEMTKLKGKNIIANYRRNRVLAERAFRKGRFDSIEVAGFEKIKNNLLNNAGGAVTNTYPLFLSLAQTGCYGTLEGTFFLHDKFRFNCKSMSEYGMDYYIPELGIGRKMAGSWHKPKIGERLSRGI